mgnify:CR=1 FL=1
MRQVNPFDLPKLTAELGELHEKMNAPDFWNDIQEANAISRKAKQIENKINKLNSLKSRGEDIHTLIELALEEEDPSLLDEVTGEVKKLGAEVEKLRLELLLKGPYDSCNAILSLHAGAGGTEAQDWVQMLFRMYTRYCENQGWTVRVLDQLDGDEAGIKSVTFEVVGENAYGYLKAEAGVHRLVRISPFDASGRRHTSFAAVEVMPEISDDVTIEIREEDIKVDTFRSGGAGGQHVNKTESAVRITHLPTGIVVTCQNERSQHQNREVAMMMLRSKLAEIKQREHLEKIEDIKGDQKSIEWGSQIRSYVFMPYTLVKDHRTGYESGNINAVMDGDLDGFITAYLKAAASGTLNTK